MRRPRGGAPADALLSPFAHCMSMDEQEHKPSEVADEGARQAEEDALCEVLETADSVLRCVSHRLLFSPAKLTCTVCVGPRRSCTRR